MGSDYDTVLGLYTGSAVNALTEVAANDDEDFNGAIYTSKVIDPRDGRHGVLDRRATASTGTPAT